jgi:type IV secretion system protein TrbI
MVDQVRPAGSSPFDDDSGVQVDPGKVRRLNKRALMIIGGVLAVVLGITFYGVMQRGKEDPNAKPVIEQADAERVPAKESANSVVADAPQSGVIPELLPNPPLPPLDPANPAAVQPTPANPGALASTGTTAPVNNAAPELTPFQEYKKQRQQNYYSYLLKQEDQVRTFREGAINGETRVSVDGNQNSAAQNPLAAMLAGSGASPEVIDMVLKSGAANVTQGGAGGISLPGALGNGVSLPGLDLASLASGTNPDANRQKDKNAFLNAPVANDGYLGNAPQKPISPTEIKRGNVIPAVMITGVNSDLPGRMIAQVSEHVYDTVTGKRLLVPQGTRLFGRYDSSVTSGQSRVLVVWTDLIFPNGLTLNLSGMPGSDQAGYAGFKDKVDNHWGRIFGAAVFTSALSTGVRYASGSNGRQLQGGVNVGDAAQEEFAREFGRVATRVIDKSLDIQPTIKIRPGYRFNVIVEKDIVLPQYQYAPSPARR